MEPHELAQAGWLDIVDGRVFSSPTVTCAGGAGAVVVYFVVSTAVAHLVQHVEVVDNSPTTSKQLLGVTGSWRDDDRSRSLRRCLWDRGARRSVSTGPGLGWSGCERPKLIGAESTTYPEHSAGLCWAGAKGCSVNTSPLPRRRARTPGRASTKRLRHGGLCDELRHRL